MAIEKQLNTRIQLKYDSLEKWNSNGAVVLKAGEIGICAISSGSSDINGDNSRPQILFKVGDGKSTFAQLPWASAKAADVYDWAKQSALPIVRASSETGDAGNVIASISWNASTNKVEYTTASVATSEGVKKVADDLDLLEAAVAAMYTNAKIDELVADAKKAGTDAAAALSNYQSSNNARVKAVEDNISAINNTSTGILATAKAYTDEKDSAMNDRVANLEAIDHSLYAAKTEVANTYETKSDASNYQSSNNARVKAVEDDVKAINNASTGILATAKAYTDEKDSAMNGRVANLEAIKHDEFAKKADVVSNTAFDTFQSENTAAIKAAEKAAKEYADDIKDNILGEGIKDTYDTLVEIQSWIEGDGVNATELTEAIAAEAKTRGEEIARVEGLISAETSRAQAAEKANADAIANFSNGTVAVAKAAEATKATQDAEGNVITATYETKTDANNKLNEAKSYAESMRDAAKSYADSEIDALESDYQAADNALTGELNTVKGYFNVNGIAKEAAKVSKTLTVKLEDGTEKTFNGAADITVDLSAYATDAQVESAANGAKTAAQSYADTQVNAEKARAEGEETKLAARIKTVEDNHIKTITAATGLKVTPSTNSAEIAFDDSVVFVFNCGSASELID